MSFSNKTPKALSGENVYCPWILIDNQHINTPAPQPQTLSGNPVKQVFAPNLSQLHPLPGMGSENVCNNGKPMHINFFTKETSKCYSQTDPKTVIENCHIPV